MPSLESAQPVVTGSEVQAPRPCAQNARAFHAFRLHGVGVLLHPRIGVFSEAARGGQKQPAMPGTLREEPFRQLETERDRRGYQIRVIVCAIRRPALGEGVP